MAPAARGRVALLPVSAVYMNCVGSLQCTAVRKGQYFHVRVQLGGIAPRNDLNCRVVRQRRLSRFNRRPFFECAKNAVLFAARAISVAGPEL